MGYWGNGLMDGDEPVEIVSNLVRHMPGGTALPPDMTLPDMGRDGDLATKFSAALDAFRPGLPDWLLQFKGKRQTLAVQALGICMIAAGMDIDTPLSGRNVPLRDEILTAAKKAADAERQDWEEGFTQSHEDFAAAVIAYRGEPVYLGGSDLSAITRNLQPSAPTR